MNFFCVGSRTDRCRQLHCSQPDDRYSEDWPDHFLQYLAPPPLNGGGQAVTQIRARYQLDSGALYHFNKHFAMFVEGENLTNTYLLKYAYTRTGFWMRKTASPFQTGGMRGVLSAPGRWGVV